MLAYLLALVDFHSGARAERAKAATGGLADGGQAAPRPSGRQRGGGATSGCGGQGREGKEHKLKYSRPPKHSLPLTKFTHLSSAWELGKWGDFIDYRKLVRSMNYFFFLM